MKKCLCGFFWFLVPIMVAGCLGFPKKDSSDPPGLFLEELTLVATHKMNDNSALAVDCVVAYDQGTWENLQSMTASAYFSNFSQLCNDNPTTLEVFRWELVPGQLSGPHVLQLRDSWNAWGGVIFANYHAPGAHRMILGQLPSLNLVLGEKNFQKNVPSTASSEVAPKRPIIKDIPTSLPKITSAPKILNKVLPKPIPSTTVLEKKLDAPVKQETRPLNINLGNLVPDKSPSPVQDPPDSSPQSQQILDDTFEKIWAEIEKD